jgi:glycosyltransferase involved in cell wall biosynthesis
MKKLLYLSGAPRVSTRPDAERVGPRTHVKGVIRGFQKNNWIVHQYIVGDNVPESWNTKGSEKSIQSSIVKQIGADIIRIALNYINRKKILKIDEQFDLVYERFAAFQYMGHSIKKKKNIPWILETNAILSIESSIERKSTALPSKLQKYEKFAYQNCDVLVCITDELRELIIKKFNIDPDKIIISPNAVNIDEFSSENHEPLKFNDLFNIGFVGSLWQWQRLDFLFDTVKELQDQGYEISLTIVGDGQCADEWKNYAKVINIKNVKFVGKVRREDVPRYIRGFDVCYSGQFSMELGSYLSPIKMYEYMAMGKPILATSYGETKRLVIDGENGYLFKENDKETLREAIKKLYLDDVLRKSMGDKSKNIAFDNHSWEIRVKKMLNEIEKILGK